MKLLVKILELYFVRYVLTKGAKKKCSGYSKNRDKSKVLATREAGRENFNANRRLRRANWSINGLCANCGNTIEREDITKCNKCHEQSLKNSITYYRRLGMLPAGQSRPEVFVFNILQTMTDYKIVRNSRRYIKSTITGAALELDIFIPDLKLAIEIDGPMHRVPCYGQQRLDAQIINDRIKNEQCSLLGIYLLRINTDHITSEDFIRTTLSQAIGIVTANSSSTIEGATHSS